MVETEELEGPYKEISQIALQALDLSAENELELTVITRDSIEGEPIAACIMVVGTPSRVKEVLDVVQGVEERWDAQEKSDDGS